MNLKLYRLVVWLSAVNITACSVYLEYVDWLDAPEQKVLFSSTTRAAIEEIAGDAIGSKALPANRVLAVYEYFDGEKCVNTGYHPCDKMSEERGMATALTVITAGVFEPIAFMRATGERKEGKAQIFVVYADNDHVLAICPSPDHRPSYPIPSNPLCDSLGYVEIVEGPPSERVIVHRSIFADVSQAELSTKAQQGKAAKHGEPEAHLQLYFNTVAKEPRDAHQWLCQSADQGHPDARYRLALVFEHGQEGFDKDYVKAYVWYVLAAQSGSYWGETNARRIASEHLTPGDLVEARRKVAEWRPGDCATDLGL